MKEEICLGNSNSSASFSLNLNQNAWYHVHSKLSYQRNELIGKIGNPSQLNWTSFSLPKNIADICWVVMGILVKSDWQKKSNARLTYAGHVCPNLSVGLTHNLYTQLLNTTNQFRLQYQNCVRIDCPRSGSSTLWDWGGDRDKFVCIGDRLICIKLNLIVVESNRISFNSDKLNEIEFVWSWFWIAYIISYLFHVLLMDEASPLKKPFFELKSYDRLLFYNSRHEWFFCLCVFCVHM